MDRRLVDLATRVREHAVDRVSPIARIRPRGLVTKLSRGAVDDRIHL